MIAHQAVLLDRLNVPVNARSVVVYDHGHRLLDLPDSGDTPEQDGCQRSFVRSMRDQRIVAEMVTCGEHDIMNYTRHKLTVQWRTPR